MRIHPLVATAVAAVALAALLPAQQLPSARAPGRTYQIEAPRLLSGDNADYREERLFGGFRFTVPSLQLEVRGTHALMLSDLETSRTLLEQEPKTGLPRRGIELPAPRRRLSPDELRARMERTMKALGTDAQPLAVEAAASDRDLELVRYLYFEGGITVVRDGVEVIRCDRLWISPLDDRIVVENAELRYQTGGKGQAGMLVVRGPRLVKSGGRWTGRDLTLTPCTAGEPHAAMAVGEAEIIERDGEFEVIARGQTLQVGGTSILPLPDAHFFTGSQSQFPIRRVSAGYSSTEGFNSEIVFGLPWNSTGWRASRSDHRAFPERVPRRLGAGRRLDPGARCATLRRAQLPRRRPVRGPHRCIRARRLRQEHPRDRRQL